ncbi:MAG: YicC/YloC family endoribonuclease, partial [Arsenophonus sp. ER-LPS3-MAG3]
ENEGRRLMIMIQERLDAVYLEIEEVRRQMPEILKLQRERFKKKIEEIEIHIENNRVEEEIIMLAQRIDVAEELDRLDSHIKETRNIFKKQESVGRRLDFMMQEFNREANTLASKSINIQVTNSAIELKVLIEQMREQIQNIE